MVYLNSITGNLFNVFVKRSRNDYFVQWFVEDVDLQESAVEGLVGVTWNMLNTIVKKGRGEQVSMTIS